MRGTGAPYKLRQLLILVWQSTELHLKGKRLTMSITLERVRATNNRATMVELVSPGISLESRESERTSGILHPLNTAPCLQSLY